MTLQFLERVPSGKPAGASLPLVILMHGRGADASDLADLAPMLDRGYRFLLPNAPKPFEMMPGYSVGYTWFDGWPPSGSSFAESRARLLEFIDQSLEKYPTPPGKLVLAGFSQGGMMALDAGFRTPHPVAGIVCMSGAIYEEDLAVRDERVLIVHGTNDAMIPVVAARRTRRLLEEHGLEPEYHEIPMEHEVTAESLALVSEFIHRVLA